MSTFFSLLIVFRAAIAFSCFVLAGAMSLIIRKKIHKKTGREDTVFENRILAFCVPLIAPAFTLVFLLSCGAVLENMGKQLIIIPPLSKIAFLWLILSFIRILTQSRIKTWIVGMILAPVVALDILGQLASVKTYFAAQTFSVGALNLSALKVVEASVLLVILLWFAGAVVGVVDKALKRTKTINKSTAKLFLTILKVGVYALAGFFALDILGVNLTALTIFGGAVGVGIGFGLQKIASNFISGIILLVEKIIEVDDFIELDTGMKGFVRHIGARHTMIETLDSREIMIPNEDFITKNVTNWTFSNKTSRIEIPVGISYGSDIDKAYELILEAAQEHKRCLDDPAPACYLKEFGDSSVNFLLYFWIDDVTVQRYRPQSDVMFSIWRKFKANGIQIPFPQRDIHIKSDNSTREKIAPDGRS